MFGRHGCRRGDGGNFAFRLFGGNGTTLEYPIEKLVRDVRSALIEDGDEIEIDIPARAIRLNVPDAILAARRKAAQALRRGPAEAVGVAGGVGRAQLAEHQFPAIHQTAVFAGGGIGAWAAGRLADVHGWSMPFIVFALLGGVVFGVLIFTRYLLAFEITSALLIVVLRWFFRVMPSTHT